MIAILGIVGALAGGILLRGSSAPWLIGLVLGLLAGLVLDLRKRLEAMARAVRKTEERLVLEQVNRALAAGAREAHEEPPEPAAAAPAAEPETPELAPAGRAPAYAEPAPARDPWEAHAAAPAGPDIIERLIERIKRWFTTGNVPVKLGVIVSVFGVGFLIKEAIDREWLVLPIEFRLVGVALFGLALLVIGWRLRETNRVYALSVQGGGIAVIYLVVYAAYALYGLLPTLPAFLALAIVTAAAGGLAVMQNSRSLAVLGIVGGFMAPVLTSSGQASHVVLFSYYSILNAAVFGIAWFKAWRLLNVLGFLFTFVIGSVWGYLAYRPEQFATTEPFLVLFVLMYTIVPVLFASRETPKLKGFVDGTLVFGTPVIGFGLQAQLVGDSEYGLAISAVALAGLYIAIAAYLRRRRRPELKVLTESFWSLSIVFLAIAVPLALNARWTSVGWSLQGAAMVWLGMRQHRKLALAAGLVLQLGAAAAYFTQPGTAGNEIAILNGYYLGALLIALAGWFSSWAFDSIQADDLKPFAAFAAWASLAWGTVWWLASGLKEIDVYAPVDAELSASLGFVAATVCGAVYIARLLRWQKLPTLGLLILPAMAIVFLYDLTDQPHPLARYGWLAWPFAFATHVGFLRLRESDFPRLLAALHTGGYWMFTAMVAAETHWWVDRYTSGVWALAATLAVVALVVAASLRAREALPWPVQAHWPIYLLPCAGAVLLVLGLGTVVSNLTSPGDPAPLPYVPLINPLELASVLVFLGTYRWYSTMKETFGLGERGSRAGVIGLASLALFMLTMIVARSVHHWGGVPFDPERLARSNVLQASLSIVWGCTALVGMIVGARAARRSTWFAGSLLMAVVVAKLFIVELGNTGTVTRVVSFLGVGVLLLVVGYFAPVPPREPARLG